LGNKDGFTLLEVIIAMAIMVVAFGSILAVEQGSINASSRAKQMNIVAMLAKNQMIETEFKIQGKTFEEVKKEEEGNFKPPYEDYHWKAKVKELKFPNIGAVGGANKAEGDNRDSRGDAGGDGQDNSQASEMLGKLVSNFLSKAIREVSVTISWKRGSGEQTFTLSTYWVDLNYEFKLTE
jgi:type II secretion system protein I